VLQLCQELHAGAFLLAERKVLAASVWGGLSFGKMAPTRHSASKCLLRFVGWQLPGEASFGRPQGEWLTRPAASGLALSFLRTVAPSAHGLQDTV
jgi:hypothetical protein